ncbi:Fic family protein [Subtercola sp. RTI3]|uniref:Fic family protein n=1 Tax=Subtercola sp. RTI3 TaxID=3048639 RepID=UPI002B23BFDB|nr:Fic family protein [Subtercola sp. RTI3]MEA9983851.1 Fic family protein [Subtercola sp. RTI3]
MAEHALQWRIDFADANLALLNVDVGDAAVRDLVTRVAVGGLSCDEAVAMTAARYGTRIAPRQAPVIHDFDDYLVPGSLTLASRIVDDAHPFGIVDADQFRIVELEISRLRLVELAGDPVLGYFDYEHLKSIHRRLFRDIYNWAGQQRVGPETSMIRFAPDTVEHGPGDPDAPLMKYVYYPGPEVAEAASMQFAQLQYFRRRTDLPRAERIDRISESGGELQSVHPFRDGNSRAMTAYFIEYHNSIGFEVDPADFLMGKPLREQMIHSWYHYQATGSHRPLNDTLDTALDPGVASREKVLGD